MMFKLYNMEKRSLVEENDNELVIVDALDYDISNNNNRINYLIVNDEKGYDDTYMAIRNHRDYIDYLNLVKNKYTKQKIYTKH